MTPVPEPAKTRILVCDGGTAPDGFDAVLLWNGFQEAPGTVSISRYLEQHGERLRSRYLAFVHELGRRTHRGASLVDHFRTRSGYSVWWMNRVAEKSPFKSPRIYDCLRLLALEEIISARSVASLTLRSADERLAEAITDLCRQLGIPFSRDAHRRDRAAGPARPVYDALPHSLQGLISFRHLWKRRGFRALGGSEWFGGASAVGFITYFFTVDRASAEAGRFRTQQWGALPQALADDGRRANWVHHYLPDSGVAPETAIDWLRRFNANAASEGRHAFLETFLTARVFLAIAGQWLWLHRLALRMRGVGALFQPPDSKASFWPLLRDDFRNSLFGTAAVSNATWMHLFDAGLARLPRMPRGFYLYEGQGWETAMLFAWRRHGHGSIYGVPHSSMPFWYLNIYDDPRVFERGAPAKPVPDGLCVNGAMARDGLIGAGYPEHRLVPVESLRYQYLRDLQAQPRPARAGGAVRLLVLGDFSPRQTLKMLQLVHDAVRMTGATEVAVKLHPSCVIDQAALPPMPLEFIEQPLGDIVREYDVAFCSNSTSAALDALLAGLRVAIFLDDEDVNQSPLRGHALASFVAEPAALVQLLNDRTVPPRPAASEFFWIDEALPRWRALIGAAVHA